MLKVRVKSYCMPPTYGEFTNGWLNYHYQPGEVNKLVNFQFSKPNDAYIHIITSAALERA